MKKSEKEHLKGDPLVSFIEDAVVKLKEHRKTIINWGAVIAFLVVAALLVNYFQNSAVQKDNEAYAKAVEIVASDSMSSGEKITELKKLDSGDSLSSILPLYVSSIYFKEGEYDSAAKALKDFTPGDLEIINEKKLLLEAEVMDALGKGKEGAKILEQLLSRENLITGKDLILITMAKIQVRSGLTEEAQVSVEKLLKDYPTSQFVNEARELKKRAS